MGPKTILPLLLLATLALAGSKKFDAERYKSHVLSALKDPSRRSILKQDTSSLSFPQIFREEQNRDNDDAVNELICSVCSATADAVIVARTLLGIPKDQIALIASELCIDFQIENDEVCHGVIDLNIDIFLYIIDNKQDLVGSKICSIFLQNNGCTSFSGSDWSVDVPAGISPPREVEPSGETIKFVHISDFHYDPMYQPGGNAACGDPLCCQSDHAGPEEGQPACGYWSDYHASDAPSHLVENAVSEVVTSHSDAIFGIYTGDIISHRVWETSVENNTKSIEYIYGILRDEFDFPFYPILGNHEPHPLNVWAPDNITDANLTTQWVFGLAAEYWSSFLPEESLDTVRRGGYYTTLIRPGLRIIGLNSNVGYLSNWWLFWDDEDPYGQLQWLVGVLEEAEQNSEAVYIISHVPPNSLDCLTIWSVHYRRIVERFANTIAGQFNGHTHSDIFSIFYNSSEPSQAINSAFNGASVTTFVGNNPSYKVYYADSGSFELLDYDEYYFNLTEANLTPDEPPNWSKLYSFKEAYGLESMRPADLDVLAENMARDKSLLEQYNRFKTRNSDAQGGCDDNCLKNNLCDIVRSAVGDSVRCDQLMEVFDSFNSK